MVSAVAASFAGLSLAITAMELFSFLDPQSGAGTTATPSQDPLLHSAAEVLPPLAAAGALFLAIAFIHHYMMRHAAVPVAGAGNRRLSAGLVVFVLCVSAGTLEFILVPQAAGGADHGAQARALGLAALRAFPAAATATFFSGMMVIIAHVRAGGEGGGGAVAGDGAIQGPVRVLTKVALGAAAALVLLMLMSFCAAKY